MKNRRTIGQALVEFSLAVTLFLVLVMAIVDFGMSIYKYNGVSQAAREIARVASVHQGSTWGSSQIVAVVATQQRLIPGLGTPTFTCTNVDGTTETMTSSGQCPPDSYVKVEVTAPYRAATPILGLIGTITMKGSSSAQIQQ